MRKLKMKMTSILSVLAIFSAAALPVCANSLPDIWYGERGNTPILMEKDCPIEVESEVLTFDIQEFFQEEYETGADFLAYDGKVTAEYTFYNPTDSKITARLAFPFGAYPSAAEDLETYEYTDDTQKYDITVNGEKIEKDLRYTFFSYYDFEPLADKQKLKDDFVDDKFYDPETTVTKYTYDIIKKDIALEDLDVKLHVKFDDAKTKLYVDKNQFAWLNEDGSYDVALYEFLDGETVEKKTVSFYVIGEDVKDDITWRFRSWEDDTDVEAETVFVKKEQMTLEELAFSDYDKAKNISKTDWYNAFVDFLKEGEWEEGIVGWNEFERYMDFSGLLMRWYEYEITIDPGEKIVNTVTAPIYPTIDKEYNPACYEYMYLLSPAKLWSDFGSLEIVINTPYHLVGDSKGEFEKTDKGYVLKREGLPEEELVFTLSESPNPRLPFQLFSDINDVIFTAMGLGIGLIILIPVIVWRRRRRNTEEM